MWTNSISEVVITGMLIFSFINKMAWHSQNTLTGYDSRLALSFLELDPSSEGTVSNRLCRKRMELGAAPEHPMEFLSVGSSQASPSPSCTANDSTTSLFTFSSKLIPGTQPPQTYSMFPPSATFSNLTHSSPSWEHLYRSRHLPLAMVENVLCRSWDDV